MPGHFTVERASQMSSEILELGKVNEVFVTIKINRATRAFDFIVTGAKNIDGHRVTVATGERVLDDALNSLAVAARNGWRADAT
jgi:hypothetical protein